MFSNPILRRELLQQLRSKKTLVGALVIAIGTGALILLRWPSAGTADVMSERSFEVFRPLAYALATATILLAPAFPATSIVRERKQQTLAMLLHAPISSFSIYIGKFLGNIAVAAVLLSATIPAVTASYSMGGISLSSQIVPLFAMLLVMTVLYTSVALWVSSRVSSSDESLRWSYATVLGLVLGTLGLGALLTWIGSLQGPDSPLSMIGQWVQAISPIPAIQQIIGDPTIIRSSSLFWPFVVSAVILSTGFSWATLRQLVPSANERGRSTGKITNDQSAFIRVIRRLFFLVDPNKRSSSIPRGINPVMVKEFRTRRFGRIHWLIRLVAVCAVVSVGLTVVATTFTESLGVRRIAGGLVIAQMILMVLMGPSLASSLIAGEIESGGWQILRMTPMSIARILSGKIFSVVWTLLLILFATLPGYVVMIWIQPSMAEEVRLVVISLAVTALLVLSLSICISSFNRRTAAATATNYIVLLVIFAGTLLVWLARDRPFGHDVVERVLSFNPSAAALATIKTPGFESYDLLPQAWIIGGSISAIALGILFFQTWRLSRPD